MSQMLRRFKIENILAEGLSRVYHITQIAQHARSPKYSL